MSAATTIVERRNATHALVGTPSYQNQLVDSRPATDGDSRSSAKPREQRPLDLIDEASMESFPASDPPCYSRAHA